MQTCFILIAATGELEDYQTKNISVSLDKEKLEELKTELIQKDQFLKEQQEKFRSFMKEVYENNKFPKYQEGALNNTALYLAWKDKINNYRISWLKENNTPEDIMGIDLDVGYSIEEISLI